MTYCVLVAMNFYNKSEWRKFKKALNDPFIGPYWYDVQNEEECEGEEEERARSRKGE